MISTDKEEGKKKTSWCQTPCRPHNRLPTNVDTERELQKSPVHVRLQSWEEAELGFDLGLDPLSIPCLSKKGPT